LLHAWVNSEVANFHSENASEQDRATEAIPECPRALQEETMGWGTVWLDVLTGMTVIEESLRAIRQMNRLSSGGRRRKHPNSITSLN
jgi:hypothetical protein